MTYCVVRNWDAEFEALEQEREQRAIAAEAMADDIESALVDGGNAELVEDCEQHAFGNSEGFCAAVTNIWTKAYAAGKGQKITISAEDYDALVKAVEAFKKSKS